MTVIKQKAKPQAGAPGRFEAGLPGGSHARPQAGLPGGSGPGTPGGPGAGAQANFKSRLAAPPTSYKLREPNIPGYTDILAIASILLGYPDAALCEQRTAIYAVVAALPASPAQKALRKFTDWWAGGSPSASPQALRENYVATFDQQRNNALYVTYFAHADARSRGSALYGLKQLYRAAGFVPAGDELPDYLPTVCQFAALAPLDEALTALAAAREAVYAVQQNLASQGSPYADLFTAVQIIIEKGVRPCG